MRASMRSRHILQGTQPPRLSGRPSRARSHSRGNPRPRHSPPPSFPISLMGSPRSSLHSVPSTPCAWVLWTFNGWLISRPGSTRPLVTYPALRPASRPGCLPLPGHAPLLSPKPSPSGFTPTARPRHVIFDHYRTSPPVIRPCALTRMARRLLGLLPSSRPLQSAWPRAPDSDGPDGDSGPRPFFSHIPSGHRPMRPDT